MSLRKRVRITKYNKKKKKRGFSPWKSPELIGKLITRHSHRHRVRRTSLRCHTPTTSYRSSRTDSCSADRCKYRRPTARSLNENGRLSGNATRAGDVCVKRYPEDCAPFTSTRERIHAFSSSSLFVVTRRYRARCMYTYVYVHIRRIYNVRIQEVTRRINRDF